MYRSPWKTAVAVGLFVSVMVAFAAGPKHTQSSGQRTLTGQQAKRSVPAARRQFLPLADGGRRGQQKEIRSASRSVSVVDGRRNRSSLRSAAAVSPGIAICPGGTTYDYQHNDGHPPMLATLGGDPANAFVHFTWTQWDVIPESIDQIDRFVNYQGFSPFGVCLVGCGVTLLGGGGGGDPQKARGGYVTCDVSSDDQATAFFHMRDEPNQQPGSDHKYGSWVLGQLSVCDVSFDGDQLPHSQDNELIWPHGDIDRGGSTVKTPGDDVYHVVSHPSSNWPPLDLQLVYWRRIGFLGNTWEGPVALTKNAGPVGSGPVSYYPSSSPVNEDVSVCYIQDQTPGNPDNLRQVVFMVSHTNGQDWINDGVSIYPATLTDNGYGFNQVTNYVDAAFDGEAGVECGGRYDFDGEYHVFWVEYINDVTENCRLRHWSQASGVISTIAQATDWPALNEGGIGGRDLVLANPGIAFGDGSTNCSDGPSNPSGGNPNSNRNYVYYLYQQYGGETTVEQADHSAPESEGGSQMNLEFYLSCSNDGGATWMPPANMTNTKSPGCDGTAGNECASERDASMAPIVNNAIHIQYILDIDAGDAVYAQSAWTFNPVMYYRIDGGNDNKIPNGVCPVIAPSFAARLTNQDPDCEFHATYSPASSQVANLIVENFGNGVLNQGAGGGITVSYVDGSSGWLNVAPSGSYSLAPGAGQTSTVTMNAAASYIQTNGEGLYQAEISISHNDQSRVSPHVIPVDFFVFNEFYCPEYVTMKTGVNSPGKLYLTISNLENFGHQDGYRGGLSRMSDVNGDSSWSIYDASLLIALPPNPDTIVFRNIYGAGNGQPGFRALGNLVVDTNAYGTNVGYASAHSQAVTVDSAIGVNVEYRFPQNSDSSEFVIITYELFNRTVTTISDMMVGTAIDFDVTPGPDSAAQLEPHAPVNDGMELEASGPQNTGHLETAYNLIYQQGVDSVNHPIVGDYSARRWKAGITAIQCTQAPRGWVASNDPWLFSRPGGGWHEGYLYDQMTRIGFEIFTDPITGHGPENDRHTVMVYEQDVYLTPVTVKRYTMGLVSSNTGLDSTDLLNTTRKAWRYAFGWQVFTDQDSVDVGTVRSYPYYAIGTHADGLAGECCGCEITKISGSPLLSIGGGEPGGCEGTIELAAGTDACEYPATAVFRLQDLCHNYSDLLTVTVYATTPCACQCPYQSDYDADGCITALDLCTLINVLFFGSDDIIDPLCPVSRGDFDCDGFPTALDLGGVVDYVYFGGPGPCDPCAGGPVGIPAPKPGRFHIESLAWETAPQKKVTPAADVNAAGAMARSVVVESKTVKTDDCFSVGVFLENDTPIRGFVVPLVIRSLDGAYPNAISGKYPSGTRLDGYLTDINVYNEYDAEDGNCKQGFAGGFGTIGGVGLTDPDALLFARQMIIGTELAAGSDGGTPSIVIDMSTGGTPGQFVIDTTCVDPCNHLMFLTADCAAGFNVPFTRGIITVQSNACPDNTTDLSTLVAPVDVPASRALTATDTDGDPVTFHKVSGPGTVTTTNPTLGTGMWEYTPTSSDCPGFDVTFEPTDRAADCCPPYTFHVDLTPCTAPDCANSTADFSLLACPKGDEEFEVKLRDSFGQPVVGYCDVTLDFSDCAPGELIPAPGLYPDWPIVHAEEPSDANGVITFAIAAGGNCPDCNVTVTAGCGFSVTVPARSVDVDGDLNVTNADNDPGLGMCRDLNGNGVVNDVDLNHFLDHCCGHVPANSAEEWLVQTITTDPDGGFVPGENVDVTWEIVNNSPGGGCTGVKASPQTTWVIDSVQMFWSDWSVNPVLNYITTLIRNVTLASGEIDQAMFSHPAPQNDVCYHSRVYSSCCLSPLEHRHCPPLAPMQCPPAQVCVKFGIKGLINAQNVIAIDAIPRHAPAWEWTVDTTTVIDTTFTTICTSELSPAGTRGTFVWQYQIGGVWKVFRCLVIQELFMGDMNDFDNTGHPNCFVDVLDLGYLIDYLFAGAPAPTPALAADIDCDGYPTSVDMAKLIDYLFAGSDPPPYCDRK